MRSPDSPSLDLRVSEAVRLMMARPHELLSVAHIGEHIGLSPSRFAHLFRAQTGSSPGLALRKIRMDQAAGLLAITGVPLKEIATRAGVSSAAVFVRSFRERYGITPSDFRRRLRAKHSDAIGGAVSQPSNRP